MSYREWDERDEVCRSMRGHTECPGFGKTHRPEALCHVCWKRHFEGLPTEEAQIAAHNARWAASVAKDRAANGRTGLPPVAMFAFFGGTTVNFDPNHFQAGKAERIEPARAFDLSKLPVIVTRQGARYEPRSAPPAERPATSGRRSANYQMVYQ